MPNIATVLKEEISRLARKEVKNETAGIKKMSAQHRRDIAELKRQLSTLQKKVSLLEKKVRSHSPIKENDTVSKNFRFTAKGLRSQRKRLGLSAADYGKLVGVGAQSVYNWEAELSHPRKQQILAIASVKTIGKKEALDCLKKLNKK
jgi:DNA-binding transcriptional regulator YiaG